MASTVRYFYHSLLKHGETKYKIRKVRVFHTEKIVSNVRRCRKEPGKEYHVMINRLP